MRLFCIAILAVLATMQLSCSGQASHKMSSATFDSLSDDELDQAIVENMWAKMREDMSDEYEVVQALSKPQQAIYQIWQLEAEVNNGGFNQFYVNSSGRFADELEASLLLIGATHHAELMHRANATYKQHYQKITEKQDGTIEGFSASYKDNPLNKLDDEFYELYKKENLYQLKIKFIRNNKEAFVD